VKKSKLKTAVLGLNNGGELLLEAVHQGDYFQIEAVADKDTELAKRAAAQYGCLAYDDYRQLVMQNQLDCLLVAAGMYSCDEHIKTAIRRKINILKLAPPARDFEEIATFVRLAEGENIKFAIANPRRFAGGFLALRDFLQEGGGGQVFLITAICNVGNQVHPVWQTDPKLAGGGVVLSNCYDLVDQMVWNFAMPQKVYSLNSNQAVDRQQRLYLTEDTSVTAMKFSDTLFANLIASKTIGPKEKLLKIYTRDKILTVSEERFVVSNHLGLIEEELKYEADELCCMMKLLENFALSITLPDSNKLCSSGRENLQNMAVIESVYLSGRTGFPEEPANILQMSAEHT